MNSSKGFADILALARDNVRTNPSIVDSDTRAVAMRYLKGLQDEVAEVSDEVKEHNSVYLADELSDIAWDYAVLLALLEERGYIPNVDDVMAHGFKKYTERSAAFKVTDDVLWNSVKAEQKEVLQKQHEERYGK